MPSRRKENKMKSTNVYQNFQWKKLSLSLKVPFELCPTEMHIPIQTNNKACKDLWMAL